MGGVASQLEYETRGTKQKLGCGISMRNTYKRYRAVYLPCHQGKDTAEEPIKSRLDHRKAKFSGPYGLKMTIVD